MQFQSYLFRGITFAGALALGVTVGCFFAEDVSYTNLGVTPPPAVSYKAPEGRGTSSHGPQKEGNGIGTGLSEGETNSEVLKITSKPLPKYTDRARENGVTGTVTLRVTFLPSGKIGTIAPVSGLADGLTEMAIAAARGIEFEPQVKNGVPVAVTRTLQYTFTIY